MATQESTTVVTYKAAADQSASQYLFLKQTAADTAGVCSAITDVALGVQQDAPAGAGRSVGVAIAGTTKVKAGAAITQGARVAPMANGKAQTAVSTQFPRGIAKQAAAADGDIIEILLIDGGVPLA